MSVNKSCEFAAYESFVLVNEITCRFGMTCNMQQVAAPQPLDPAQPSRHEIFIFCLSVSNCLTSVWFFILTALENLNVFSFLICCPNNLRQPMCCWRSLGSLCLSTSPQGSVYTHTYILIKVYMGVCLLVKAGSAGRFRCQKTFLKQGLPAS